MTLLSSPPTPTDAGANSIMSTPIKPTTTATATTTKENDDVYTPCKTAASTSPPPSHQQQPHSLTTPEDWYLQGERVWYDPQTKQVVVHEELDQDHQDQDEQQPQPREEGQEEEEESGEDSVDAAVDDSRSQRFKIFQRIVVPEDGNRSSSDIIATPQRWMTFLPNNPEGSYGFHMVEEALSCGGLLPTRQRKHPKNRCDTDSTALSAESITETNNESLSTEETAGVCMKTTRLARLYLDYQGQGDSDTFTASSSTSSSSSTTPPPSPSSPTSAASSGNSPFGATTEERSSTTKQRADLVEALWEANGIKRTVVVSAGDSSLVVMELLQRQRQRLATGCPFPKILHVLSLNGRYVAKTRHAGQLATITQCLRSERMGSPLANKAQKSDFTLSQCLGPYLKGSSRPVRKQVAKIVKRHNGASSLVEMARTVDDHLYEKHRYRWHLPHLFKVFTLDQGITFHLVTNTRSGQRQVQLVQQQLEDYDLLQQENQTNLLPGLQVNHYGGLPRAMSTSTFLLDSSTTDQFETFIKHVRQLAFEEIPLSDNSCYTTSFRHSPRPSSFDQEDGGAAAQQQQHEGDEVDSWHPNEEETSLQDEEHEEDEEEPSLDTRLDREIVFDASEMEDDDFDFF